MGIVVVIIAVLAIIGWAYNSVKSDQAKEKANDLMKEAVDAYCEFNETSLAFGTSKLGADNIIAYIIKENDVKAAALKGKAVMFKDTVTTVEYDYAGYYREQVPTIVFGNRQYVSSDFNKELLKHEVTVTFLSGTEGILDDKSGKVFENWKRSIPGSLEIS